MKAWKSLVGLKSEELSNRKENRDMDSEKYISTRFP